MFFKKTIKIINDLSKDHKIAVFSTMGCDYRDPYGNVTVFNLKENDFKVLLGSIAKTQKFEYFVIDNIFNLFDSLHEIKRSTDFLTDIAREHNITIIT